MFAKSRVWNWLKRLEHQLVVGKVLAANKKGREGSEESGRVELEQYLIITGSEKEN